MPKWCYIPPRTVTYETYEKITDPEQRSRIAIYSAYTWNPDRASKKWKYGEGEVIINSGKILMNAYIKKRATLNDIYKYAMWSHNIYKGMDEYSHHYNEVGYGDDWSYRDPLWEFYI